MLKINPNFSQELNYAHLIDTFCFILCFQLPLHKKHRKGLSVVSKRPDIQDILSDIDSE